MGTKTLCASTKWPMRVAQKVIVKGVWMTKEVELKNGV